MSYFLKDPESSDDDSQDTPPFSSNESVQLVLHLQLIELDLRIFQNNCKSLEKASDQLKKVDVKFRRQFVNITTTSKKEFDSTIEQLDGQIQQTIGTVSYTHLTLPTN